MDFEVGDVVKFNEKGLAHFSQGDKRAKESRALLRWTVVEIENVTDRWGNKCLTLLGRGEKRKGFFWSPSFFQKAPDEEKKESTESPPATGNRAPLPETEFDRRFRQLRGGPRRH